MPNVDLSFLQPIDPPPRVDRNGAALDARQMTAAKEDTTASIDKISDPAIKAAFQKILDLIQ